MRVMMLKVLNPIKEEGKSIRIFLDPGRLITESGGAAAKYPGFDATLMRLGFMFGMTAVEVLQYPHSWFLSRRNELGID